MGTFKMKIAFLVHLEDFVYQRFVFKSPLAHQYGFSWVSEICTAKDGSFLATILNMSLSNYFFSKQPFQANVFLFQCFEPRHIIKSNCPILATPPLIRLMRYLKMSYLLQQAVCFLLSTGQPRAACERSDQVHV